MSKRFSYEKLAYNDFKKKFAGSYLGTIWAFVQPVVTVFVYWFVFEKSFHASGINARAGIEAPFVLWLTAGMVPWFFFSEAINNGNSAMIEYSYLVKKVVFKIEILPVVRVIAAVYTHIFFTAFMILMYILYGWNINWYVLQLLYYSFAVLVLTIALSYFFSAISVFFRDMIQLVNILLQLGIWATPIMWNIDTLDANSTIVKILRLNPMFYIVQGYRDSMITSTGFWKHPGQTAYFWVFTLVAFLIGKYMFNKLRPHFADVL